MDQVIEMALNKTLVASNPTWTMRTADNAAVLRLMKHYDDKSTGYVVYKHNGVTCVNSFYYYPQAINCTLPVAFVLTDFFSRLRSDCDLDVEYLDWSEVPTLSQTLVGHHLIAIGSEVLGSCMLDGNNSVQKVSLYDLVDVSCKQLVGLSILQDTPYCGPTQHLAPSESLYHIVDIPPTRERAGVYMTENSGRLLAEVLRLDETVESGVVYFKFPVDTKIITTDYLLGLLLEVYCQCPNKHYFINRYRLTGADNLKWHLTDFIEKASVVKQQRNRYV